MDLENKYSHIFELNNNSPLFARVASDLIANNNFDEANDILDKGIELFENYPTPFFLLGDLLLELGKIDEAKAAYSNGHSLLKNSEAYDYYLSKINNLSSIDPFDELEKLSKKNLDLASDNVDEEQFDDGDLISETEVDDNLDELADKLKSAKIEISDDVKPSSEEKNNSSSSEEFKPIKGLVSETLASIYFNQSNYKEAKAIYETLIEIQPERADYFKSKISEVESRMRPRS